MGRQINKASVRQQIATLDVGGAVEFPIGRYEYVTSMGYRVGLAYKHKYSCTVSGDTVKVTRTE